MTAQFSKQKKELNVGDEGWLDGIDKFRGDRVRGVIKMPVQPTPKPSVKLTTTRWSTPTALNAPGDGHEDEIAQRLALVQDKMEGVDPSDEFIVRLKAGCMGAANAIERCRRFTWNAADMMTKQLHDAAAGIQNHQRMAAAQVPTSGHGSPVDYEAAKQSVITGVMRSATAAIRDSVVAASSDDAHSLAEAAFAGMTAFSEALDSAESDATAPEAMRRDVSPQEKSTREAILSELWLLKNPCAESLLRFNGYLSRGEIDKATRFAGACSDLATATIDTDPQVLASRRGDVQGDAAVREQDEAFKLRNTIRAFRESQTPESIKVALDCFEILRELFSTTFGMHANFQTSAEFAKKHLPFKGADAGEPKQLDPLWTHRFLPPDELTPVSGWSPKIMKTAFGGIVRKPKDPQ